MRLQSLQLTNFKGQTELHLPAHGQDTAIYGANGTGKTTVADAFYFLLFGKDSLNRKDFEILPLDGNGKRKPEVTQAEVEGIFDIDGKEVTLKRVYAEKWVKTRGKAQREFTGHETLYYIDGVPMKQKDYDAVIKYSLCVGRPSAVPKSWSKELARNSLYDIARLTDSEDVFKLLTNPRYFCEVLTEESRRNLLLKVCSDISDEDVIASDDALADLPAILDGLTVGDRRKVIKARHTEINKELDCILVRIDEAQRKPVEEVHPLAVAELKVAELKKERNTLLEKKIRIESGGQIAELTKRIQELDAELLRIENEAKKGTAAEVQKHQQAIADLQMHITNLQNQIKGNQDVMKRNNSLANSIDSDFIELRKEWASLSAKEFQGADTCPTCGQSLPAEQVEAAKAKFNADKSKRLEKIQNDSTIQRKKLDELKTENDSLAAKNAENEQSIAINKLAIKEVQGDIAIIEISDVAAVGADDIITEIKRLADDIVKLKSDSAEAAKSVQAEINNIDGKIAGYERIIAQANQRNDGLKRIEDLEVEQKNLAKEYADLERQLHLINQFIQLKVGKINGRFQIVQFKLFDEQLNGGLAACCEVTVDGIPYGGGLNNGARINAGLDIINTLSKYFKFAPVVFIDNAEAIDNLIQTSGQQIKLIKPPMFDDLPGDVRKNLANVAGSMVSAREGWNERNRALRVETKEAGPGF